MKAKSLQTDLSDPKATGKSAIAIVYSYYPADPRPRREAEALVQAGMDVELICLRGKGECKTETVNGVRITRVPLSRSRKGKTSYFIRYLSFFILSLWTVSIRCLRRKYEVVHVHNMPDFLVFSAVLAKLRGARIILDLHDPMPELFMSIYGKAETDFSIRALKKIEQASISFSDIVLTPNTAFKDVFVSRGAPPEKVFVLMNTPQGEIFNPESIEVRRKPVASIPHFTVMYHGSLVQRHGLDMLVCAIARVRSAIPNIKLQVYGERTDYFDEVLRLATELGLENIVDYKGWLPLERIAEAISDADLGVIPNRRNCFTNINLPTRIFEYLAMNKPVIAPRTKGISEYFNDTQLITFEPDDLDDLANKIRWASANTKGVSQILQNGRSVFRRHQWVLEKAKLVALVQGLLALSEML